MKWLRLLGIVAVVGLVLAVGGVEGGQAQTPGPCVTPSQGISALTPGEPLVLFGIGDATITVEIGATDKTTIGADVAYSGHGRFSADWLSGGDQVNLMTAIAPKRQGIGFGIAANSTNTVHVTADGAWSIVLS